MNAAIFDMDGLLLDTELTLRSVSLGDAAGSHGGAIARVTLDPSITAAIEQLERLLQPSDFAGLALIVNLASMLAKRQQNIDDIRDSLIPILFWCGIICGRFCRRD